jgi:streptogramin lyase
MPEQSWIITTEVGTGEKGYAGDGGPAARALLNGPFDVGFDARGNLYFSDTFNHCIRRVDARTGVITTCAGCGEAGYSGDGGPATRARFNEPYGIAVDNAGNIYVADRHNHCVRRIDGG